MSEQRRRIVIISTGGTIEKTFDELQGVLENRVSVLDVMLASLQLDGVEIERIALMNKDSLEMTREDHVRIANEVEKQAATHDGVVVTHGTDRLAVTGETICQRMAAESARLNVPVVLIGAMRPYALRRTDALQNLTEALLAVQILRPGVYCVMHNQVLQFPGVIKDRQRGTFVKRQ